MILIVDNTQRKMRSEVKAELLKRLVPCVVTDVEHTDEYLPTAVIVVTERYILEDVKYISSLNGKSPVFLWDEKTKLADFAMSCFTEVKGDIFENSKISRVRTSAGKLLFCGKPMYLTRTEKRIIYLLQYSPRWYERSTIAAYCLKAGKKAADAAAVHICNINAKANRIAHCDIIECRRYSGYRLRMF